MPPLGGSHGLPASASADQPFKAAFGGDRSSASGLSRGLRRVRLHPGRGRRRDRPRRIGFGQRIDFGQGGRGIAHVELAGDHVGDEAGAVFVQEFDLGASSARVMVNVDVGGGLVEVFDAHMAACSGSEQTENCPERASGR